ncbi:MAG: terminase large subunit [Clostridia bacterium]|nr:terminase large subunit [Clostridia bacterium]
MTYIEEYYNFLLDNPEKACHKVLTVYKKLVEDIKNPKQVSFFNKITESNETHTFIFNEKRGNKPIEFIERFCKHSKGKWAGRPVELELFQKAFIQALFGFIDKDTGIRKYKKGALFIGRKNGKSTMDSGLANYMLTKDGEGGAEVYSVATKKDQAKVVWDECKRMIKKSPALNKRIRCLVGGIFYDETESFLKALASDSNSLDGLNAHFVVADEVHAWKDKNLLDVMYDSMSAREQPMLLETSTMGTIRESVFDNEYEYFSEIIKGYEGLSDIVDETVLPVIYELDSPDEWQDERKWYKANPGLGTIKKIKDLRDKVNRAKNNPNELLNLLCKDFNIRQNGQDKWLSYEIANNEAVYEMKDIQDTYAVAGVDLSSTTDLTCATILIFKNGIKYVLQQYFIAEANLQKKIQDDKIPYDIWEKKGLVTLCEGAKINYTDVTEWFNRMHNDYEISAMYVGYDPWNSQYWVEEMKAYGYNMIEIRQGAKTMSNPMKELYADLSEKKVNYNNNPILKWCLTNTSVKRDENDNIRPVKGHQQRARIDGTVSLIIAYCVLAEKYTDYMNLMEE